MPRARLRNIWSYLPALGALLLGFGALDGGARAERPGLQPPATPSSQSALRPEEILVRIDGEKVYTAQDAGSFEELRLGDTPEAAHLRELLREEGADRRSVSIPVGAMIVASGGGSGKGDKPSRQNSRETGTGTGSGK
jgi:hypothetical protein